MKKTLILLLAFLTFGQVAWAQTKFSGGNGTMSNPYRISRESDWYELVRDVNSGNTYSGCYFQQTEGEFRVNAVVGNSMEHSFQGIYDGGGHSICVTVSNESDEYIAPFRFVKNATFKRVYIRYIGTTLSGVLGNLTVGNKYAGGLIGRSEGNVFIENCRVCTAITTSFNGDLSAGGIVGLVANGTLTIENCLYEGRLYGTSAHSCGGFVGWVAGNNSARVNITNSLFRPLEITMGTTNSCTFARSLYETDCTFNNCYYTQTYGNVQGINGANMNASQLVAALGPGWHVDGSRARPKWDDNNLVLATVTGLQSSYDYTGSAIELSYNVYNVNGTPLTKGTHYTEEIRNGNNEVVGTVTERGIYTLTLTGANSYFGSKTFKFYVGNVLNLNDINTNFTSYTLEDGSMLTGTLNGSDYFDVQIRIADGATVILSSANIYGDWMNFDYSNFAGLTCLGDATLILADGTVNTIRGFQPQYPGILVPQDHTLTIKGNGTLNASNRYSDYFAEGAAGIGGRNGVPCGHIVIKSGTINAQGGKKGAGIGGSYNTNAGSITIEGGTVNATGGIYAAGIGCGDRNNCNKITITGGIINAQGGEQAAGIGGGANSTCGPITITTGITSLTARCGSGSPTSIGKGGSEPYFGFESTCGTVTIGCTKDGDALVGGKVGEVTINPYNVYTNTILFRPNGGTGTMDNMNVISNVETPLTPNAFTREGYAFMGWNTEEDGSGVSYFDQQGLGTFSILPGEVMTLHAQWFTGSENTLTISSVAEWNDFVNLVNTGQNSFSGKQVYLMDNISVSTMVGTSEHPFQGIFNGNGRTLNVTIGDSGSEQGIAPFHYISGATIRHLKVTGTVYSSEYHAGGLVGFAADGSTNTLQDCQVSTDVTVTGLGGGIVGHAKTSTVNMNGCVFNGTITNDGFDASPVGGLVGWSDNTATLNFTHSLFDGTYNYGYSFGGFHPIAVKDASSTVSCTVSNTYYSVDRDPASSLNFVTYDAKLMRSITPSEGITMTKTGAYSYYTVSGITGFTRGIKYNNTIYAGNGDEMDLYLSCNPPIGSFLEGFHAQTGTLTEMSDYYRLTMSDVNDTIYADFRSAGWTGSGTSNDPFIITTCAHLNNLATFVNRGLEFADVYFKLGADIAYNPHVLTIDNDGDGINESNFAPIGGYPVESSPRRDFRGHFDGDGHTISGIIIRRTGTSLADDYQGLFGSLYTDAEVKNVTLTDTDITGHYSVGGIAGYNEDGVIMNCHVTSSVIIRSVANSSSWHGGIVGDSWANKRETVISQCTSAVQFIIEENVTGCARYGGIVGNNRYNLSTGNLSIVRNNLVTGVNIPVTVENFYGAIVGVNASRLEYNYYNSCTVHGATTGVGCFQATSNTESYQCDLDDALNPDGAMPLYAVSHDYGITLDPSGFVSHDDIAYYKPETTITIAGAEAPNGYTITGAAVTLSENTFTMPATNINVAFSADPTADCDAPTNLASIQIHPSSATLGWDGDEEATYQMRYRKRNYEEYYFFEDFEVNSEQDLLDRGWTILAGGVGLGGDWKLSHEKPVNGLSAMYSQSKFPEGDSDPDTWLITPQLDLQGTVRVWMLSNCPDYSYTDFFEIRLSTTGTDKEDFTTELVAKRTCNWEYNAITVDMSGYAGQKGYIAIRHFSSKNCGGLFVDDFCMFTNETDGEWVETNAFNGNSHALGGLETSTQYEWQVRRFSPGCTGHDGFTEWSGSGFFTTYEPSIVPDNLAVTNVTATTASLEWNGVQENYNMRYRVSATSFFEDFEHGLPSNWTIINKDGDSFQWERAQYATYAHSGESFVRSRSGNDIQPDNWLITPQLKLSGTMKVWIRDMADFYYADVVEILLSTTGTAEEDFTRTLIAPAPVTGEYVEYNYNFDESEFKDQLGYIAIRHTNGNPSSGRVLIVDDFGLYAGNESGEWEPYNNVVGNSVVLPGLMPNTPYEWKMQGISPESLSGVTDWSKSAFFTTVAATFTKDITAHGGGNGGWYLIASPLDGSIAPAAVDHLEATPAENYDLYRFNQSAEAEWENYKNPTHTEGFVLESGQGYLYANANTVTLTFNGLPYNGTGQVTLRKDNEALLSGYNLIGNPFGTSATITNDFYRMNDLGTDILPSDNHTVEPMEGIFVIAENDGETVSFVQQRGGAASDEERIVLNLVEGDLSAGSTSAPVIDRAIVRLGENRTLPKFQIRDNSTKLYLPQGGEEYAIVSVGADVARNVSTEIPINFKANENGSYTLSVNPEGVEMAYLHLIDNFTGADVDLLAMKGGDAINRINGGDAINRINGGDAINRINGGDAINRINGGDAINRINGGDAKHCVSTYTFEAKTTDLESRFKLVFAANNENGPSTGSGAFAFINNGNIVVNGEGTLQVVDVMGRVIVCRDAMHCVSTNGMPAGVYVLRLVNGDNVKVQKVVVR